MESDDWESLLQACNEEICSSAFEGIDEYEQNQSVRKDDGEESDCKEEYDKELEKVIENIPEENVKLLHDHMQECVDAIHEVELEAINVVTNGIQEFDMRENVATVEMCNVKTIKNDLLWVQTLEKYILDEKSKNNDTAFLWNDFVYTRGFLTYDQNLGYQIFRVKLIGCSSRPFHGAHYIQIEDQEPFWVHSLTALRRHFFKFKDYVSFERSTFYPLHWFGRSDPGPSVLLRLKLIRHLFDIPKIDMENGTKIYRTPDCYYTHKKTSKSVRLNITERTKSQVDRVIRCLINTLNQEFKDKTLSKAYLSTCIDKI